MEQQIKEIPFNEEILLGVKDDQGQIWLAVKQVCLNIGLSEGQARRQLTNVQGDLVFTDAVRDLSFKFATQVRKVICIKEEFVTLWLAKIHLTPTMKKENPKTVDKLVKYQLEAQKVLHNYFMGTEEKKQEFFSSMGLQGEIADLKQEVVSMKGSIDQLIESSTINTTQQQIIHHLAKDKVNNLLGGAHSWMYKTQSKSYFVNLWNNFKERFHCVSYRDLNPKDFMAAKEFINNWTY